MKSKIYILGLISSFFITTNADAAYGVILCEPLGNGSFLCDAHVENVNPSNASYNWLGSGANVQGNADSAYVNCYSGGSSAVVSVTVTDNSGSTTISRGVQCKLPGGGLNF